MNRKINTTVRLGRRTVPIFPVEEISEKIEDICREYAITLFAIFGSSARGDNRPDSDIDILVRFKEVKSLLEIVHIQNEVSEVLKRKVDLVTEGSIPEKLKKVIISDSIVIYEER